jgi:hypothetical protein
MLSEGIHVNETRAKTLKQCEAHDQTSLAASSGMPNSHQSWHLCRGEQDQEGARR